MIKNCPGRETRLNWAKMAARPGYLEVAMGSMFAGKTSHLLRNLGKWVDLGFEVLYINHSLDARSAGVVSTHSSHAQLAPRIKTIKSSHLEPLDVSTYRIIGVDEAQFFPDLVRVVRSWVEDLGKIVYVVGLDGTSQRKPFGDLFALLPLADDYFKLKAVCAPCLKEALTYAPHTLTPAPFTYKRIQDDREIAIGAGDLYEPVCRYHWHHQSR